MWREYFGIFGAAIAVINGLIAIFIALLPVRRSVIKLRLGAAALALGVLAAGAGIASGLYTRIQHDRQLADRREARERLEGFIGDGRAILGQIRDPQKEMPNRAADEWAQRTEIYLRDKLGELYVARFRKDVNEMYGDAAVPVARLDYWRAVRNRLVNLETMTGELPQPLRPSLVSTPKL
jgi:hypothetical protein